MNPVTPNEACDPAQRAQYEIRVRDVLTPDLLSYLNAAPGTTTTGRGTVVCLHANTELDVTQIVALLSNDDVDILSIRRL